MFGGYDLAGRFQAVNDGHADVHQDDVGLGPASVLDSLRSVLLSPATTKGLTRAMKDRG